MTRCLPLLALLLPFALAAAREWHSADGGKSFEGRFAGLKGDQLTITDGGTRAATFPISAFAAEDQAFAKTAQAIADDAAKRGVQSFEIGMTVDGGCICRLALPPASKAAPVLYTGDTFFLVTAAGTTARTGDRVNGRLLFGAGGRTFHPLKGDPMPIRAYALDAEEAAQVWTETVGEHSGDPAKQSPPIVEPQIEIVTTRGIGIGIGKAGVFLIDAALVKDAGTVSIHQKGEDHPAAVVRVSDELGVAIVTSKLPFEPARLGPRKPAELGQSVYAVSAELSSTKKTLATKPVMTRGIVSRVADGKGLGFQHDATVPPECLGGFVIGAKGDVLGVFFNSQPTTRAAISKKAQAAPRAVEGLGACISTGALAAFVEKTPGIGVLRTATGGAEMDKAAAEMMSWTVLVVATREERKTREIAVAKNSPSTKPDDAAIGWSLSKSGTRHNAKCRYYDPKSPCAATDGKPCKTCGG